MIMSITDHDLCRMMGMSAVKSVVRKGPVTPSKIRAGMPEARLKLVRITKCSTVRIRTGQKSKGDGRRQMSSIGRTPT